MGNRAGTVTNISEVFQYSISWVDLIFGEREGRLILRHFDCEIQFSHSLSNLKIHLSTGDKTTNQQYKTDHQNFNHRHDENEGYVVRAWLGNHDTDNALISLIILMIISLNEGYIVRIMNWHYSPLNLGILSPAVAAGKIGPKNQQKVAAAKMDQKKQQKVAAAKTDQKNNN